MLNHLSRMTPGNLRRQHDTQQRGRRSRAPVGTVVVGGGPGGVAACAALRRVGESAVAIEQAHAVGQTWRNAYDRLRLNTSQFTSRLLGQPYPREAGLFPTRDQFVAYLEEFVQQQGVQVQLGTRVERIDREDGAWRVCTSDGDQVAERVIIATGYAHDPVIPAWPGRDRFRRPLKHSADYRNPSRFRGRDVLVVGAGSSGMEIANDLVEGGARRVRLAVRTPPNIILREVGGLPGDLMGVALLRVPPRFADVLTRRIRPLLIGDLTDYGLPQPHEGPFKRLKRLGVGATVVDREVIRAVRDRCIEVVAGVESLDATGVRLSSGERIEPDAIIAATGYRCALEPLVGHLEVLDASGIPRVVGGSEAAPGLRFIGFVPVPGQFGQMSMEATRAALGIARTTRGRHGHGGFTGSGGKARIRFRSDRERQNVSDSTRSALLSST